MAGRKIRPVRVEGEVAFIPLTQGYEAIVDATDLHLVAGHNWTALRRSRSRTVYAYRAVSIGGGKQRNVLLHRVLLSAPSNKQVDHISGDGLDNRRSNLRLATNTENSRNQPVRKSNTSGFKGADFHKAVGLWRARIRCDGNRRVHLGYFATPEEAHAAYCVAARKLHGEFARNA